MGQGAKEQWKQVEAKRRSRQMRGICSGRSNGAMGQGAKEANRSVAEIPPNARHL